MYQLKHIVVFIFTFLLSAGMYGQVHIGDGVTISEGASMVITNQDVVLQTEEIKGEGNLIITNETKQKITVNKDFKPSENLTIATSHVKVDGDYATKFSARYLPKLSNEVRIAAAIEEKEKLEEKLPIRYVNTEGLVFDIKDEPESEEPTLQTLPVSHTEGVVISEVFQIYAVDFNTDYIIPIYSKLNDVRFSDDAKLYEFESLTAILKPPIV